ncbi:MAG: hypothetical protein M3548_19020 [Actinomycetota bacterium]|nr:hypothetical protein [Actinomycetota bacterium]
MAFTLRGRASGDWLVDRVEGVLQDGPIETLTEVLDSDDRGTRRTAYRVGAGRLPRRHLLTAALPERDVVVRRLCADAVLRDADDTELRLLAGCSAATIRADAVQARALGRCRPDGPWLSHPLPRAQDPWIRVLLDLRLLDDPDLRLDAKADLANWVRYDSARTWSRPTGARAETLDEVLRRPEVSANRRWTGYVSSAVRGRPDGENHTRSRG